MRLCGLSVMAAVRVRGLLVSHSDLESRDELALLPGRPTACRQPDASRSCCCEGLRGVAIESTCFSILLHVDASMVLLQSVSWVWFLLGNGHHLFSARV